MAAKRLSKLTLVAEEAAPALLAVTLPGLLAGAVEAARVADTVVTVTATEPHPAPGNANSLARLLHKKTIKNVRIYIFRVFG